jgi:hypothetical protein
MLRVTATKVDLDFTRVKPLVGDLEDRSDSDGYQRRAKFKVPILAGIWGANEPRALTREGPIAVLHGSPYALRDFANELIEKVDAFEKKTAAVEVAHSRRHGA